MPRRRHGGNLEKHTSSRETQPGASFCWMPLRLPRIFHGGRVVEMTRNGRKQAILAFLAARTGRPATVSEIAWGIRLPYHRRGLYGLLRSYAHWNLIILSGCAPDGQQLYRIGERGLARLAWLRSHLSGWKARATNYAWSGRASRPRPE